MPVTAAEVIAEAAAMCGDRNMTLYTQDRLLPLLVRANRDLSLQLGLAGINVVEDVHISSTITAVTGLEYPNPPNDLFLPIKLWERADDSSSDQDWEPMSQNDWDPADPQHTSLEVWKWEEDVVKFLGATTARKVKMSYQKNLASIVGPSSAITVINGEHFLSAKTASYAARFVGKNATLGAELNSDAQQALDLLLGIRVKEDQNEVLRMLPYSMNAKSRGRR